MKTMKSALLLAVFVVCGMASAKNAFPEEGSYHGSGHWRRTDSDYGSFSSVLKIERGRVSSEYRWDGRVREKLTFQAHFGRNGFFKVDVAGDNIGGGSCGNKMCQWGYKKDGKRTHETIHFLGDKVYRFGSRWDEDSNLTEWWEETLEQD